MLERDSYELLCFFQAVLKNIYILFQI